MSYPIVRTTKAKAIAAAVGGLATVIAAVFADDVLDTSEVGSVIAALVAAAGTVAAVFQVENKPKRTPQ
jgi:hypothetical protein